MLNVKFLSLMAPLLLFIASCADEENNPDSAILTCTNQAANETRHYCVSVGVLCWNTPIPSEAELCSWAWYGNNDHQSDMSPVDLSSKYGTCDLAVAAGNPDYESGTILFPSWWKGQKGAGCLGGGGSPDGGTTGGTSAGSDTAPTTTEATTEATTEDTAGTTTGVENDGPGDYYCSLRSDQKCANLTPDDAIGVDPYARPGHPEDANYDVCWTGIELTEGLPKKSVCVYGASSRSDAIGKCEAHLLARKNDIIDACDADDDCAVSNLDEFLDGTWTDAFGGSHVNDDQEKPAKFGTVSGWACDGEALVIGDGPYSNFEGSGTFITPDGTSAGMSGVRGLLGFKVSNCTTATCTVTVDTLVGVTRDVSGGYTNASGLGGTFAIRGMGFQSHEAFSGVWNKGGGTVTFPTDAVNAHFWAETAAVDGLTVAADVGPYGVEITQVVGSLRSEAGPLSLNLVYEIPLIGTAAIALRTM